MSIPVEYQLVVLRQFILWLERYCGGSIEGLDLREWANEFAAREGPVHSEAFQNRWNTLAAALDGRLDP